MKKLLLLTISLAASLALISQSSVSAVSGFNAGNIIDDAVFTNKSSMSVGDIQTFLNSKVPNCDTNGTQPSEYGGGTRAQWGQANYGQSTFTCLKDYRENGNSSAQIIYNVAQQFSINPQVLIVLLQKEQGLVTDTWPLNIQYRTATGYGCPDTAPCDSQYFGLSNQLTWSGRMFRAILNNTSTWYTPYVLGNNFIQYSPDGSCGGSNVNIQNRSTQALYNYTPYQPNQGSLDAGWGQAHCGSYGNRNFFLYFTNWFGSVRGHVDFTYMQTPRWMQLAQDVRKVDPLTGQQVDEVLPAGTKLKFSTKTAIATTGSDCLRTKSDTLNDIRKCIPLSAIQELTLEPQTISPVVMRATTDTLKYEILTDRTVYDNYGGVPPISNAQQLTFTGKLTLGTNTYYITKHDMDMGINYGILSTQLSTNTATYQTVTPQLMELTSTTTKQVPTLQLPIDGALAQGMQRLYSSKTFANGKWYYRTQNDTNLKLDKAIAEDKLAVVQYESFQTPRWMQVIQPTSKVSPVTNSVPITGADALHKGQFLKFTSKVEVNGGWYYRTDEDTTANTDKAVASGLLAETLYEPLSEPRSMTLIKNMTKAIAPTAQPFGETFPIGMARTFTSRVQISGVWYYRTESDTNALINLAFPVTGLEENN